MLKQTILYDVLNLTIDILLILSSYVIIVYLNRTYSLKHLKFSKLKIWKNSKF